MPSRHLWVKICANTTLEDARLAADLGADAVGFVFAPSKRQVTVEEVAAITPHLPETVEKVGVFLGSTPEDAEVVARTVEQAGLTAVQLHGGPNPAFAQGVRERLSPGVAIVQTAHWMIGDDVGSARSLAQQLADLADAPDPDRLLLDAKLGASSGGLGVSFDWSCARPVLAARPGIRIIVAGGLNPENVGQAIACLAPYGVDVASGVEQSPGKKDATKLGAFIRAARGAL